MLKRLLPLTLLATLTPVRAAEPPALPPVAVYGPTVCLACIDWTEYLRENGFSASYTGVPDMAAVKRRRRLHSHRSDLSDRSTGRGFGG